MLGVVKPDDSLRPTENMDEQGRVVEIRANKEISATLLTEKSYGGFAGRSFRFYDRGRFDKTAPRTRCLISLIPSQLSR